MTMPITTNLTIRINTQLKKEADELFSDLGLNTSTAFNMFVRQAIRVQGLPFEVTREKPNTETLAAMHEAEKIASGEIPAKSYKNAKELFKDVGVSL